MCSPSVSHGNPHIEGCVKPSRTGCPAQADTHKLGVDVCWRKSPHPDTSVSQGYFFLCLPFRQPSNSIIKGNLGPLTTSASTQEKGHSCPVLATWLEQPEIFSYAGRPGGLEANMWDFSWVCFVKLGSARTVMASIRASLTLVCSSALHHRVQG